MEQQDYYSTTSSRIQHLKEQGKFAEAAEEIRLGLEKNPQDFFLKASLADLFLRQGRLKEGRILAEEVLSHDPQHIQALSVLGDYFLKNRSPEKALLYYHQALNRDPRPFLILKTARALKEMRKLNEALQELEKVLVLTPENPAFLKEKAIILNRQKKYDQALEVFETVKTISPNDLFVQKEILRLRSRSQPQGKVLRELKTVLGMESKKDDAQMHGFLAQNLKEAGHLREAAAEYRQATYLEPRNPYFLKQEGFCHYRLKDYKQAVATLSEAFRKDPSDYYIRGTLEKSFQALSDPEGWLALLEEVAPQHPEHKFLLGLIKKSRKNSGHQKESEEA